MNAFYLFLWSIAALLIGFICLFVCFMLYLHYIHKINDHLPGPPRSSFILGNLPDIFKHKKTTGRTTCEYFLDKQLEYGPIIVVFLLHRALVVLGDPNYIRQVFVDNHKYLRKNTFIYNKFGFVFGERGVGYGLVTNTDKVLWRKRRRIMNPAFHRKCLQTFMNNFNNVCDRFLIRINGLAEQKKVASMVVEFSKVSLETISQVSFNVNTNAIEDPESPFPSAIRNYLKGVQANLDTFVSPTLLTIFQFRPFRNASKNDQINAARYLRSFAFDCITARMKDITEENDVPDDLLSVLIKDGSLAMEDIIDEFLTIFIAGHETTANTLAFTLYEIIRNPHVEVKLLNEVKEVLGEREVVSFDDLPKLKYLGQVFDESQRKHPIAPAPSRILEKDIIVGGYQIRKGSGVASYSLYLGMNPEIWPDPTVFDPERFSDAGKIPNFAMIHFPFSVGPRNCIGQTFAKFEFKVILAKLLQKFQFKLLPNQTDCMEARMTMTPRDGVICKISRRE